MTEKKQTCHLCRTAGKGTFEDNDSNAWRWAAMVGALCFVVFIVLVVIL